jgi:hypothetical protein
MTLLPALPRFRWSVSRGMREARRPARRRSRAAPDSAGEYSGGGRRVLSPPCACGCPSDLLSCVRADGVPPVVQWPCGCRFPVRSSARCGGGGEQRPADRTNNTDRGGHAQAKQEGTRRRLTLCLCIGEFIVRARPDCLARPPVSEFTVRRASERAQREQTTVRKARGG